MGFTTNREGRVKGVDCFGPCKRWNLDEAAFTTAKNLTSKLCKQCSDLRIAKMKKGFIAKKAAEAEKKLKQAHWIKGFDKCETDLDRLICVVKEVGVQEDKLTYKAGWMKDNARRLLIKLNVELAELVKLVKAQMHAQ